MEKPVALEQQIRSLIEKHGLSEIADRLVALSSPSIRLKARRLDEDEIPVGRTRIGGMPDLPEGIMWPANDGRPLEFIAQISLSEIHTYDHKNLLPAKGMLYFFIDPALFPISYNTDRAERTIYYSGEIADLHRVPVTESLDDADYEEQRVASCMITLSQEVTLPPLDSSSTRDLNLHIGYLDLLRDVEYLYDENLNPELHRLLGYPDAIHHDMQWEAQQAYEARLNLKLDQQQSLLAARQWVLLLQIDSGDTIGRDWGNSGRLYYWIRKEDLALGNFAAVYFTIQHY